MVWRAALTMHAVTQDDTTTDLHDGRPAEAKANARQVAVADLRYVMGTKQGRRFVHRLLASTGLYQRSFTGNSETFFKEGRRAVGLDMLGEINEHAFQEYVLMLQEARTK